ncbi:BEN domain-containing protein 7 isoform X3 [Passer domesticus]|uniref:BEN domain-containing protein 7 isoform X3 n=1 Tax=Passer domesticus TaxID=48849 RepID=UPI0030FE8634
MALPLSPSPSARGGAEWRRAGPGVAAAPGRRNRRLPSPSRWHRGPGAGGEAIAGRPSPPGRGRAAGGGEGGGIAPAGLPPPHPAFPQSSGRERGGDRSQLVPDPFIRRRSRRLSQPPRALLIGGTELGPVSAPLLPARTMEFAQRKRSRKSQSFKLVNEDYHHEIYKISDYSNDVNGETKETQPVFLGDESREIKKQITGMRRLLNDSTGRIYQRVGKEGEKLKEEPQDLDLAWAQRLNPPAESQASLHPSQSGAWNELSPQASHFSGQYGTRSKTFQNQARTVASNGEIPMVNSSVGPNCCTCNCQSTLQAILQELKTMRKLMQLQAVGTQNRQQPPVPLICAQKSTISRKRNKKRKLPLKVVEAVSTNKKPSSPENEKRLTANTEQPSLQAIEPPLKPETPVSGFGIILESTSSDPEVQLAEGFDVFMPKSQLDSILSNYTRSGSLLFRKLVCAFFDDKTLANSLPNGKRKRGLNDNRKGLDQNIVGAIKDIRDAKKS